MRSPPHKAVCVGDGARRALVSASEALALAGHDLPVAHFRTLLEAQGYVVRVLPASMGGCVYQSALGWAVTPKGLPFGCNFVDPSAPEMSVAQWYVDTFPALLVAVGLRPAEAVA
ncbi:MAG: hypothetical protein ACRCYV_04235 [Aeromonas sp.]